METREEIIAWVRNQVSKPLPRLKFIIYHVGVGDDCLSDCGEPPRNSEQLDPKKSLSENDVDQADLDGVEELDHLFLRVKFEDALAQTREVVTTHLETKLHDSRFQEFKPVPDEQHFAIHQLDSSLDQLDVLQGKNPRKPCQCCQRPDVLPSPTIQGRDYLNHLDPLLPGVGILKYMDPIVEAALMTEIQRYHRIRPFLNEDVAFEMFRMLIIARRQPAVARELEQFVGFFCNIVPPIVSYDGRVVFDEGGVPWGFPYMEYLRRLERSWLNCSFDAKGPHMSINEDKVMLSLATFASKYLNVAYWCPCALFDDYHITYINNVNDMCLGVPLVFPERQVCDPMTMVVQDHGQLWLQGKIFQPKRTEVVISPINALAFPIDFQKRQEMLRQDKNMKRKDTSTLSEGDLELVQKGGTPPRPPNSTPPTPPNSLASGSELDPLDEVAHSALRRGSELMVQNIWGMATYCGVLITLALCFTPWREVQLISGVAMLGMAALTPFMNDLFHNLAFKAGKLRHWWRMSQLAMAARRKTVFIIEKVDKVTNGLGTSLLKFCDSLVGPMWGFALLWTGVFWTVVFIGLIAFKVFKRKEVKENGVLIIKQTKGKEHIFDYLFFTFVSITCAVGLFKYSQFGGAMSTAAKMNTFHNIVGKFKGVTSFALPPPNALFKMRIRTDLIPLIIHLDDQDLARAVWNMGRKKRSICVKGTPHGTSSVLIDGVIVPKADILKTHPNMTSGDIDVLLKYGFSVKKGLPSYADAQEGQECLYAIESVTLYEFMEHVDCPMPIPTFAATIKTYVKEYSKGFVAFALGFVIAIILYNVIQKLVNKEKVDKEGLTKEEKKRHKQIVKQYEEARERIMSEGRGRDRRRFWQHTAYSENPNDEVHFEERFDDSEYKQKQTKDDMGAEWIQIYDPVNKTVVWRKVLVEAANLIHDTLTNVLSAPLEKKQEIVVPKPEPVLESVVAAPEIKTFIQNKPVVEVSVPSQPHMSRPPRQLTVKDAIKKKQTVFSDHVSISHDKREDNTKQHYTLLKKQGTTHVENVLKKGVPGSVVVVKKPGKELRTGVVVRNTDTGGVVVDYLDVGRPGEVKYSEIVQVTATKPIAREGAILTSPAIPDMSSVSYTWYSDDVAQYLYGHFFMYMGHAITAAHVISTFVKGDQETVITRDEIEKGVFFYSKVASARNPKQVHRVKCQVIFYEMIPNTTNDFAIIKFVSDRERKIIPPSLPSSNIMSQFDEKATYYNCIYVARTPSAPGAPCIALHFGISHGEDHHVSTINGDSGSAVWNCITQQVIGLHIGHNQINKLNMMLPLGPVLERIKREIALSNQKNY